MKKIFALIITACLSLALLSACSNTPSGGNPTPETTNSSGSQQSTPKSNDNSQETTSVSLETVRAALESSGYKTSDTITYMGVPKGTKGFSFEYKLGGSSITNSVVEFANTDELNSYLDMAGEGVCAISGLLLSGVSEKTDTEELEFLEKVLAGNPPSDYIQ